LLNDAIAIGIEYVAQSGRIAPVGGSLSVLIRMLPKEAPNAIVMIRASKLTAPPAKERPRPKKHFWIINVKVPAGEAKHQSDPGTHQAGNAHKGTQLMQRAIIPVIKAMIPRTRPAMLPRLTDRRGYLGSATR
jgi:hypothetical protein